jgi:hypothetical protein
MPDYSTGYQFKLIGDGEEAGSWGRSTNENLKKIEAAVGLPVEIDITVSLGGSTWDASTDTFTWITQESSKTGTLGARGRCSYVNFKSTVAISGSTATVEIRGNSVSEFPDRTLIATNSLSDGKVIVLDIGGATYTLRNGCTAHIFTSNADIGGAGVKSVQNALGTVQLTGIDFAENPSAEIAVAPSQAAALSVTDGTLDYLVVDTDTPKVIVGDGATGAVIEASGVDNDMSIKSSGPGDSDVNLTPSGTGNVVAGSGEFVGDLTGDVVGNVTGSAGSVVLTDAAGNAQAHNLVMGGSATGTNNPVVHDGSLTYTPAASILHAPGIRTPSVVGNNNLTVEALSAGTLTVKSPILTTPTVGATDWASANHTHVDASTGGVLPNTALGLNSTVIVQNLHEIDFVGEGYTDITGEAQNYYGRAFSQAHGVTSVGGVSACLKYTGDAAIPVDPAGGGTTLGSGPNGPNGWGVPQSGAHGWSIGDRVEMVQTSAYTRQGGGITAEQNRWNLNSNVASGQWGWSDTHVWLILGVCADTNGTNLTEGPMAEWTGDNQPDSGVATEVGHRFFSIMDGGFGSLAVSPSDFAQQAHRIYSCTDWVVQFTVIGD